MASITEQEDKVDDGEDEIKNIYDICGIPGLFKHILIFLKVKSILKLKEYASASSFVPWCVCICICICTYIYI